LSFEGKPIHDVIDDLSRTYIDVEVEAEFKRGPYNGTRSLDTKPFRVVGVRDEDAGSTVLGVGVGWAALVDWFVVSSRLSRNRRRE
jgi:IS4 transposase